MFYYKGYLFSTCIKNEIIRDTLFSLVCNFNNDFKICHFYLNVCQLVKSK